LMESETRESTWCSCLVSEKEKISPMPGSDIIPSWIFDVFLIQGEMSHEI